MTDFLSLPVNSNVSESLGEVFDYYVPTTNLYGYSDYSGYYYDFYQLSDLSAGSEVTVNVSSSEFDTYLLIFNAGTGEFVGIDDDGGGGTNSQFTFSPVSGNENNYYALVSSYWTNESGAYNIELS